ncbi:uncharacterized protein LOC111713281 [Eurytemora carolleeae]|uniref:uncharacterized protein LOC111713281 n=1 Tax=Eurytemora carolleeae TaxID=1294199 RepID=UPI000C7744BD|nr:uncharacterized protein LOC111713281 [Eurytemora carolleeae]|eukprot:XP_023343884.1 uncharacterized protein LOC111713281 [Eurytemora affinis]
MFTVIWNMKIIYFYALIFIKNAAALDIAAAFERGLFEKLHIEEDNLRPITFDPYRKPSQAYFWNKEGFKHEQSTVELEFNIHNLHENFFFPGLSLIVLKTTFKKRQVNDEDDIEIYLSKNNEDDEEVEEKRPDGKITKSHDFPKTGYSNEHIFQTWPKGYEDSNYTIKIKINNLKSLENIYFVVTAYRISKNLDNTRSCEDNSRETEWFDCNRNNVENNQLLCISDELTCNSLPHCASTQLPNPDENCGYQFSFENALELLLYTLTVVFFLILVAGIVKCMIVYFCRSGSVQSTQMFREYLRNGSISRPLNSPPTYDDAMREVNDAFSYNESSEVEDDPPEYTPQPQNGETVCNTFVFTTNDDSEDPPPVNTRQQNACGCSAGLVSSKPSTSISSPASFGSESFTPNLESRDALSYYTRHHELVLDPATMPVNPPPYSEI